MYHHPMYKSFPMAVRRFLFTSFIEDCPWKICFSSLVESSSKNSSHSSSDFLTWSGCSLAHSSFCFLSLSWYSLNSCSNFLDSAVSTPWSKENGFRESTEEKRRESASQRCKCLSCANKECNSGLVNYLQFGDGTVQTTISHNENQIRKSRYQKGTMASFVTTIYTSPQKISTYINQFTAIMLLFCSK